MATYTPNYNLSKPESTDTQASLVSAYRDNMDIIDKQMGNKNIAEEYDNTQTYAVDDYVIYDGDLYKCTTAVTTAEDFDSTKWTRTVASDEFGSGGSGSGGHTIVDPSGTEMIQRSKMQFTGNVEVSDDSTNNKTVVNVPREVVHLTKAEYDALPNSKLTDDVIYMITDEYSASDVQYIYMGTCYSTTEREVGTWIDGKPIYQRTWEFNSDFNIPYFAWTDTPILKGDIEYIISADFANVTNNAWSDVSTALTSSQYVQALNSLNATISVRQITLRYTKTTDVAGSGVWTPTGTPTVHYSTTEQVIGTWIDGKPLYEKSFDLSNVTLTDGYNPNVLGTSGTGIIIHHHEGYVSLANYNQRVPLNYYRSANEWCNSLIANNDNLVIRTGLNAGTLKGDIITIQYTKTTD